MAKFLMTTIQVNLVPNPSETNTNSPELSLLNILPLAYHHSHFLATTLDFTMAFLGPHTFFTAGLFGLDIFSFGLVRQKKAA